ncbi:MAG TPA: methyl-accepting chemotaxis protein, partial [Rhodocyclaceae bacterium]|nr:methyl-accepting chemotaxis protein [Rhodocyclaceae bacterium]
LGQSHNIVRHPDMPPQAFEDLWRTVKAGLPWRGLVKNRCKNGDHYWVEALVTPIKKKGVITGYLSVRTAPTREQVKVAEELYARLRQNHAPLTTAKTGFFARLSLRARLWGAMGVMVALMVAMGIINLSGLADSNTRLESMYRQQLIPSNAISRAMFLLGDNRSQVMLGLQHDPGNPNSKLHDHPLSTHIDATLKNREEINKELEALKQMVLSDKEKALLDKFAETRERFSKEGVNVARGLLANGEYVKANEVLLTKINPLYKEMKADGDALIKAIADNAEHAYGEAGERYQTVRNLSIASTLIAALIAAIGGWLLVAAIVGPIRRAIGHFERIAEGDLTDDIDVSGRDEAGLLLSNLAIMQGALKAMLDDVSTASTTIDNHCAHLEGQMRYVTEKSIEQQSSVESVAAASEEFSQSVQEVAANARETADAAKESQSLLADSNENIGESMRATNRVVEAVQASSETINELNRSIQKIGEITNVISEIAGQTNLLALNAAIEAARAGEQGRGFAVVADEVRKLAERTTASTADIAATVHEIQSVTRQAVSGMDTAAREVETGIGKLRESVAGLEGITHSSQRVTQMSESISDAARQQGIASEEVAVSMQRITDLIEHNTESAKAASQAVEELLTTAHHLDAIIKNFELHKRR